VGFESVSGDVNRTDDDIMREAAGARPAAFAELFERHHGRLYGYLRKLTGTTDGAHDLTQETFLIAFRSRGSYRPKGRFPAWLYRIATNLARARIRRTVRERTVPESAPPLTPADGAAPVHGPAEEAQAAETRRIVEDAMMRLSDDEREVVLLRHFQGLRFREVAAALDINENTAKSRMRYALDKLANMLKPQEKELQ